MGGDLAKVGQHRKTLPKDKILDKAKLKVFPDDKIKTLWEEEKTLENSIFSSSHNVFYPFQTKFQFFIHIYFVICKCFEFGSV